VDSPARRQAGNQYLFPQYFFTGLLLGNVMNKEHLTSLQEYENLCKKSKNTLKKIVKTHGNELAFLWNFGDGDGGALLAGLRAILIDKCLIRAKDITKSKKEKIPFKIREEVFIRDGHKCLQCNEQRDLTVDHIHPKSKGGALELSNLQTLCRKCNAKKGSTLA